MGPFAVVLLDGCAWQLACFDTLACRFSFLEQCRPLSVSMGNAIRYVKHEINQLGAAKGRTDDEVCRMWRREVVWGLRIR